MHVTGMFDIGTSHQIISHPSRNDIRQYADYTKRAAGDIWRMYGYYFVVRKILNNTTLFKVQQGMMLSSQKMIILGISVVLVAGTLGFDWIESLFPPAEAHGVQAQLQSRFVIIQNETFDRQSLQTGETLTISGQLVSLVERDLWGWLSIFSESANAGNRWEVIARDLPDSVFDKEWKATYLIHPEQRGSSDSVFNIEGNTVVPYSISAIPLEAGVYHVHTHLIVVSVGPGLGPGQTVVVEGDPIIEPISYDDIADQFITLGKHLIMFAISQWQVMEYILLVLGDPIPF